MIRTPLPMLITGIAGVPGYNAFHYFRSKYGEQVIGIRQSSMWPLQGDGIVPCDVEDVSALTRLWDKYRFKSVLNAAGSCRLKSCELDPEMAHRVNVVGTENIMRLAERHGSRVVHLSIDLVFAGREQGQYIETDRPDPVTVYGAKMVEAERLVRRYHPDSCTLRISLPMGISFNGHAGAIDWIASRFKQNKPATLYFDEVRTPKYTDCMNRLFDKLMMNPIQGTYHAGGAREMSLFQIAQVVNVVGGFRPELLQGCPRLDAGPMPPRAGNVTLDSSKLISELGYQPFDPWPYHAELVPDDGDWHFDRDKFVKPAWSENQRFNPIDTGATQNATTNPQPVDGLEAEMNDGEMNDAVNRLLYCNPNQPGNVPPSRNELWGGTRFN